MTKIKITMIASFCYHHHHQSRSSIIHVALRGAWSCWIGKFRCRGYRVLMRAVTLGACSLERRRLMGTCRRARAVLRTRRRKKRRRWWWWWWWRRVRRRVWLRERSKVTIYRFRWLRDSLLRLVLLVKCLRLWLRVVLDLKFQML